MKDRKNIDRLFQEKFRDFEKTPHPEVWENISVALPGKQKKDRRVLWLWFSGVAAGLAVLFSINNPFITVPNTIERTTTDTEDVIINPEINTTTQPTTATAATKDVTTEIDNNLNTESRYLTKTKTPTNNKLKTSDTYLVTQKNPNLHLISPQNKEPITQQNKEVINLPEEQIKKVTTKNPPKSNNSQIANNLNSNENAKQPIAVVNDDLSKPEKHVSKTKSNKKWVLSTIAAPVFLSALDKGDSSIDSQFNNNDKEGQLSASYGIQLAYQVTDRLMIQSGLHKVDYGYKTNDVFVSAGRYGSLHANINYDDNDNLIDINSSPSYDTNIANPETRLEEAKGSLTQVFGYYEIPLEAKYNLKKGDFGVNILGGFSTLLLNKNEIYIQTDNFSNKIGEASNLNRINLSGNLGLEFDYKIHQNVHFNVTPMIKVHTNTFEKNTGGFSPYVIGVYSGLNFRF